MPGKLGSYVGAITQSNTKAIEEKLKSNNKEEGVMSNKRKPINLYGPPGIGDLMWLLQMLYPNTDRDFNIFSWERSTVSSPMLLDMERIKSVQNFKDPFKSYSEYKNFCNEKYKIYKEMTAEEINDIDDIYLEANTFMENGNRLETYFPKLKTQFQMPWKEDKKQIKEVTKLVGESNTILLYTSSVKNNMVKQLMGSWNFDSWIQLISLIFKTFPNIKIAWVGSNYDTDAMDIIKETFPNELISYYVDKPATFLLPLMKQSKCFLSYQSGLSCISMSEYIPTYMFYFTTLRTLPKSICPPDSVNNPSMYNPVFFDEVKIDDVLKWIEPHLEF